MYRIDVLSQELATFRVVRQGVPSLPIASARIVAYSPEGGTQVGEAHSFPENIIVVSNLSRAFMRGTSPVASAVPVEWVSTIELNSSSLANRDIKPLLRDGAFFCVWVGISVAFFYAIFRFLVIRTYPNKFLSHV